MDATKGNPLADVARTSVLFKYADVPQEKSRFEKSIINFFRKKFFSDYIKHYLKISGVNIEQVEEWELPVAAARLREGLSGREREALANFVNNQISEIYRK
jgi:hypothetical protein